MHAYGTINITKYLKSTEVFFNLLLSPITCFSHRFLIDEIIWIRIKSVLALYKNILIPLSSLCEAWLVIQIRERLSLAQASIKLTDLLQDYHCDWWKCQQQLVVLEMAHANWSRIYSTSENRRALEQLTRPNFSNIQLVGANLVFLKNCNSWIYSPSFNKRNALCKQCERATFHIRASKNNCSLFWTHNWITHLDQRQKLVGKNIILPLFFYVDRKGTNLHENQP